MEFIKKNQGDIFFTIVFVATVFLFVQFCTACSTPPPKLVPAEQITVGHNR